MSLSKRSCLGRSCHRILGAAAGVAMATAAIATGLVVSQVLPYIAIGMAVGIEVTCLYSHIQSKREEAKWNLPENQAELKSFFENRIIIPKEGFHPIDWAAYMAVAKRNIVGYVMMPTCRNSSTRRDHCFRDTFID